MGIRAENHRGLSLSEGQKVGCDYAITQIKRLALDRLEGIGIQKIKIGVLAGVRICKDVLLSVQGNEAALSVILVVFCAFDLLDQRSAVAFQGIQSELGGRFGNVRGQKLCSVCRKAEVLLIRGHRQDSLIGRKVRTELKDIPGREVVTVDAAVGGDGERVKGALLGSDFDFLGTLHVGRNFDPVIELLPKLFDRNSKNLLYLRECGPAELGEIGIETHDLVVAIGD